MHQRCDVRGGARRLIVSLAGFAVLSGAIASCSDDNLPIAKGDTSTSWDAGVDAGDAATEGDATIVRESCLGKADGTSCSDVFELLICLNEYCVTTRCGDGFTNTAAGEACDDANDVPDDGCNACRYSCDENSDCDDGQVCNGSETCSATEHLCVAGELPTEPTSCTTDSGGTGTCRGGVCAAEACGNGDVESGEECDDGNTINGDGCESDCTYSCKEAANCDDGDVCNGKETCDTERHVCVNGTALVCDDQKDCTADSCDSVEGCVNRPLDNDRDGYSCEMDCNDSDPAIYVGAPEYCDGKDNDCNGQVDDGQTVKAKCYTDNDGDSFAPANAAMIEECVCPSGYTLKDPSVDGQADCSDSNSDRFPGQTYQTSPYCVFLLRTAATASLDLLPTCTDGWDYDCSGAVEKQYTSVSKGCSLSVLGLCLGSGWISSVPDCGVEAAYRSCSMLLDKYSKTYVCTAVEGSRQQGCR